VSFPSLCSTSDFPEGKPTVISPTTGIRVFKDSGITDDIGPNRSARLTKLFVIFTESKVFANFLMFRLIVMVVCW
jgi:hypothetical protein